MIPCRCQTTGHEPGCVNHLGGVYVNGVKMASCPWLEPYVTVAPVQTFILVGYPERWFPWH